MFSKEGACSALYSYEHHDCPRYPHLGATDQSLASPCQTEPSPRVCVIRRFRLLALLAVVCAAGCSSNAPSVQERERLAEQQRLLALCQTLQPRLPAALQRFETAQRQLAAVRQSTYQPTAPPKPLDQEEQRRLTIYDQQTEEDLHEQAVEAWRRVESDRRERWEAEHSAQERAASNAFNAAANSLQQLHPELVQAGSPPRLNREEVERFRSCQPERFR
jgi:hypothetical protein